MYQMLLELGQNYNFGKWVKISLNRIYSVLPKTGAPWDLR